MNRIAMVLAVLFYLARAVEFNTNTYAEDGKAAPKLDLSTFPRLKGASQTYQFSPTELKYGATEKADVAYRFIKDNLTADRWLELPVNSHSEDHRYWEGYFERAGYRVLVTVETQDFGPYKTSVQLRQIGNIDPKTIPRLPDTQIVVEKYYGLAFTTKLDLKEAFEKTHQSLLADGWQLYYRDQQSKRFYQKGKILLSLLGMDKIAGEETASLGYELRMLPEILPIPQESTLQNNPFNAQTSISFTHAGSKEELAKFYQAELTKLDWQLRSEKSGKNSTLYVYSNAANDEIKLSIPTDQQLNYRVSVVYECAKLIQVRKDRQKSIKERIR